MIEQSVPGCGAAPVDELFPNFRRTVLKLS